MTQSRLGSNMVMTVIASFWTFAGRGIGLLWTFAVIFQLGIEDYGRYAMGFALATVIAVPIDNYYFVGSVRSDDESFRHDRTTRLLIGALLFGIGLGLFSSSLVIALGFVFAGGEIIYNAFQSRWMRAGRPDRLSINGMVRQTASVLPAMAYLMIANDPTIEVACLIYATPYLAILVGSLWAYRDHSPALPSDRSRTGVLFADAVCIALYEQADVLLLGAVAGARATGYYATAQVTASAASSVGISYAQTFHETLRAAGGNPSAGPPRRTSTLLGCAVGGIVVGVGGVLCLLNQPTQLWLSFVTFGVFTAFRVVKHTLTIVLIVQKRDRERVLVMSACIVIKAIAIVALAQWGAVAAAVATLGVEVLLVGWYSRLVFAHRGRPTSWLGNCERSSRG